MKTNAYEIIKNTAEKKIEVTFFVSPSGNGEEGIQFAKDLEAISKTINASEYALVLDCLKFTIFTPKLIPILEQIFGLYKACNFTNVTTIVNQSVLAMQLKRINKNVGLNLTVDLRK